MINQIRYVKPPYSSELIRLLSEVPGNNGTLDKTIRNLAEIGWTLLTEEAASEKYPELVKNFMQVA